MLPELSSISAKERPLQNHIERKHTDYARGAMEMALKRLELAEAEKRFNDAR